MTDLLHAARALPLKAHFLLLILVFIVVGAFSALYIHHQTYKDAEHAAVKHARFAAKTAAEDLSDQVVQLRTQITGLAAAPGLAAVFQKPEACTLQTTQGHIDIIAPNGHAACSSLPIHGVRDYSHESWFRGALHHPVLVAPVRDPANGKWAVVSASPLPGAKGVAAGVFELAPIGPLLGKKYSGGEPFVFTVTTHTRVLARSIDPDQFIGLPVLHHATPLVGSFQARDRQNVLRFFSSTVVPKVGWRMLAGEKYADAVAPGQRLERRQFGILIVGLFAMLLATLGVYWLLSHPIREMRRAIRRSSTHVPVAGPRELGALAGDINAMLGRTERERQAQKMEALGRLASGIAHDFNNLLLIISSGARSLIRRSVLDDKGTESVERIDRAAHRGQQLTTQLLAFARQRSVAPVPTDVNTVVREMSQMLERLIRHDVTTQIDLTPELPPILIDEGQLAQVVLNLSINANDAMPDGGTLNIGTSLTEVGSDEDAVPGKYVQLEISDTGAGMTPDTMARVFEPFFTTKKEGTGLGLATVHGIVTAAGGLIDVTSELGKGTTFRLRFPHAKLGDDLITNEHTEIQV